MPISFEKASARGKLGGRPAGAVGKLKKIELAERQTMEKLIYKKTAPLVRAGMSVALGQTFVYRIDKELGKRGGTVSQKHVLIEDAQEIARALDQISNGGESEDGSFYYITAKEPDIRAIEMLLNRAYGKPKESLTLDGEVQFSLKALAESRRSVMDEPLHIENEIVIDKETSQ